MSVSGTGEPTAAAFQELVAGRRGHFRLESGLHGGLKLFLPALMLMPGLIGCGRTREPVPSESARREALNVAVRHTLSGHTNEAWSVAFSPDGQWLASGSVDGTARLWSVSDGTQVKAFKHPAGVTSVAFSPDGQWLASGGYDKAVRLWRAGDAVLVHTLSGHTDTVWSVAFSPDGQWLASAGTDKTIRIWRMSDATLARTIRGHTLIVWSVAFSPDSQLLASGSFDHAVKLWRVADGAAVRTLSGHSQAVISVAFSPDGRLVSSGSDDKTVKLWQAADGRLARTLSGDSQQCVYAVAFSPDGKYLASGSRDSTAVGGLIKQIIGQRRAGSRGRNMRIWRVEDGALLQTLSGHSDDVHSVRFSPDGRWLASSGTDKTVILWQLDQLSGRGGSGDPKVPR